jgi:hypothetical protein
MRSWNGECSRAFTDWRGLNYPGVDRAWLIEDGRLEHGIAESLTN